MAVYHNNYLDSYLLADPDLYLYIDANNPKCWSGGDKLYDLSPNQFIFSSSNPPSYSINDDGRSVIRCNYPYVTTQIQYFQSTTNSGLSGNNIPVSVFAVVHPTNNNRYGGILSQNYLDTLDCMAFILMDRDGYDSFATDQWNPAGIRYRKPVEFNKTVVVNWNASKYSYAQTTGDVRVNNVMDDINYGSYTVNRSLVNLPFRIGNWSAADVRFNFHGDIECIMMWKRRLTENEINKVTKYLMRKYNAESDDQR